MKSQQGLSYLEMLAVIIVIALVAAMAIPNFLPFRSRSKVSRVKSDMRSLATAIEAYFVDNNAYPAMVSGALGANAFAPADSGAYAISTLRIQSTNDSLSTLTKPIGYISGYFPDAFAITPNTTFGYRQYPNTWILISFGPDRDENATPHPGDHYNTVAVADLTTGTWNVHDRNFEPAFLVDVDMASTGYLSATGAQSGNALHYDPTNGTVSEGDIVRHKQ